MKNIFMTVILLLVMVGTCFAGLAEMTETQKSILGAEVEKFNACMLDALVEYPDKEAPAAEIVFVTAGAYCEDEGNDVIDVCYQYGWTEDETGELVGEMLDRWIDLVWRAQNQ